MLKYKYYPPYLILLSIAAPQCLISQLRQARERLAKQDARARTRSSSGAFACECAEQLTESRKLCTAARRCRGYRGIPPVLLFFCRRFLFQIKRAIVHNQFRCGYDLNYGFCFGCRVIWSGDDEKQGRKIWPLPSRPTIIKWYTLPAFRHFFSVWEKKRLQRKGRLGGFTPRLRRGYWRLDYKN